MDVRALGSRTSAPLGPGILLFFQDFEGLTEAFALGRPPGYPRGKLRDIQPQNLLLSKGPFRTKSSTALESVVLCYCCSFSLSVPFSCPCRKSLSVVFLVREGPLGGAACSFLKKPTSTQSLTLIAGPTHTEKHVKLTMASLSVSAAYTLKGPLSQDLQATLQETPSKNPSLL